MDQRTRTTTGTALVVVSALVVLLYAIPRFDWIPGIVGFAAAIVLAGGTLLVGTSAGGV